MSILHTTMVCNKIISQIKGQTIKSYDEVLSAVSVFTGKFRRQGLADMCWNLRKIDYNYSVTRMLVHKYDYRFQKFSSWNSLSDRQKQELAVTMHTFESRTNLICGVQYDFYLGKKISHKDYNFVSPYVYFLPAVDNNKCCIEMINLTGDRVFFSTDSNYSEYDKKIREWNFGGMYSLNKLTAAINDKRLIFNLDNEILIESDYGV